MEKIFLGIAALFGAIGVAAGAFGAHALANLIPADRLDTFETAVRYQMYHVIALIAVAWALTRWSGQSGLLTLSGWLFFAGILLFSGSLYILSLSGVRWLGAITPFGGVAFVAGWLLLAYAVFRG